MDRRRRSMMMRQASPELTFIEQMLALPGLVTYYKLDEISGLVAANAEGTAARDGTYAGSIPLASVDFPVAVGGSAPNYADASDNVVVNNVGNLAAWDYDNGWVMAWVKQDAAGLGKTAFKTLTAVPTPRAWFRMHNDAVNGYIRIDDPNVNANYYQRHDDWTHLAMKWQTGGYWSAYLQGTLINRVAYTANGAALTNMQLGLIDGFRGAIAHFAFGAGSVPTDAVIDSLYRKVYPVTAKTLFVHGDSFAAGVDDTWIDTIIASARNTDNNFAWRELKRLGYSGETAVQIAAQVSDLNSDYYSSTIPDVIIHAYGTNDVTAGTSETDYKNAVRAIINADRAKFPQATIFKYHPYRADGAYDATCLMIKSWDEDVIAEYPSGVLAGVDGNINFKTNIATWTPDNIHPYTEAGRIGFAADWIAILTAAGVL